MRTLTVLLMMACFSLPAQASKLDCVRDAVEGDSGSDSSDDSDDSVSSGGYDYHDEHDACEYGGCDTGANLWWTCLFPPIGLFICLPAAIIGTGDDPGDEPPMSKDFVPGSYFSSRPYAYGHRGHLYSASRFVDGEPQVAGLGTWSARFSVEYAHDFHPVHRPNLSASIDSVHRFGLTTRWTHYIEPEEGGQTDQLTIGDVNLTFRFAQRRGR